jgi:hypothetical protein
MSLILCQIQSFITVFWNCPLLPKFSQWQILLAIVVLLDFSFCFLDPISSSHDCITIQLYLLQPSHARDHLFNTKKKHKRYRRCHRTHHKQHEKHPCKGQRVQQNKKGQPNFDGWALIPDPAPNIADQISQTLLEDFISTHDPSQIVEIDKVFSDQSDKIRGVVSVPLSMISTCKNTQCLSNRAINLSLVIDSRASVCISPHKGDFILYGKSNMKIKDLSSSNNVAGEGIICWNLKDVHGSIIQVKLKGYHMPNAEVRLLSPQVLIKTVGGRSLQTKKRGRANA